MAERIAALSPGHWSRARWLGLLGLVLAVQVWLIFWLGERDEVPPRSAVVVPTLSLAPSNASSAELLTLLDPTLFALPHRRGFSGEAWLKAPAQLPPPFAWSEPPRWLPLPLEQLGATFHRFTATNQAGQGPATVLSSPQLVLPELLEPASFPTQSTFRLAGDLFGRHLLRPPELCSWTNSEILTNSVVQLAVDAEGQPVSVTLLQRGSGSAAADEYALRQARVARFQPLPGNGPEPATNPLLGLTWGDLIFQWHTLPVPPTNAPPNAEKLK